MKFIQLVASASCLLISQLPAHIFAKNIQTTNALHEKRSTSTGSLWRRTTRVSPAAIVPLRIGLVQSNLANGYEEILAVSHPSSPRHGQFLSVEEVNRLFEPSTDSVSEVRDWLVDSGVERTKIVHSENKGWLAVDIPAGDMERLFLTELHEYEHSRTGTMRFGCDEYHLPKRIQRHVDYVTSGVKMSAPLRKRSKRLKRMTDSQPRPRSADRGPVQLPKGGSALPPDLRQCGYNMTPTCIRALYSIPESKAADPSNSPGFYEQGTWYSQQNLDMLFRHLAPWIPEGTGPIQRLIDGAQDPVAPNTSMSGTEANIDLQVAFGLVYPTVPTIYQVDDTPYEKEESRVDALFNTFLDALDGSYCNYTAYGITGDSRIDPKYPDVSHPKHGYQGELQCGVYTPTKVISISYGEGEIDIPKPYEERQCNEFLKLGLQGHTIFVIKR